VRERSGDKTNGVKVVPGSDGQGRGGRTRHWLTIGVLRNHRGSSRMILGGVGAGDTPSIRVKRKKL
jgi:hypothetical protein